MAQYLVSLITLHSQPVNNCSTNLGQFCHWMIPSSRYSMVQEQPLQPGEPGLARQRSTQSWKGKLCPW